MTMICWICLWVLQSFSKLTYRAVAIRLGSAQRMNGKRCLRGFILFLKRCCGGEGILMYLRCCPFYLALRIFNWSFHGSLYVESDSSNPISWVYLGKSQLWKLEFYSKEMKDLASNFNVIFLLEVWSASGPADDLAKQGITRTSLWEVYIQLSCVVWYNAFHPSPFEGVCHNPKSGALESRVVSNKYLIDIHKSNKILIKTLGHFIIK